MRNFRKRAITSIFFVIILIGGILYSQYTLLSLFLIIAIISLHEFLEMIKADTNLSLYWFAIWIGIVSYSAVACYLMEIMEIKLFLLLILFSSLLFIIALFQKSKQPVLNLGNIFTALIYVVLPYAAFVSIAFVQEGIYNPKLILGFLFLLWANDTGAYLNGVQFGRTKLMEKISPKKTWEGFAGGLGLSIITAIIISRYFVFLYLHEWIIVSILIVIFGTLGDLVESMFKRSMNVKDSGKILPGHGGLLDRFDGLLMAAPFVLIYLIFLTTT